jgi:transposase
MSRVSIAAPHLSAQAVREKMKTARSFWHRQKWLVVYNALVDPRTAEEIAQHTGVSVGTVHKVISEYNRKGSTALSTPGKGGRRNQYLTLEQEKAFLATFKQKAAKGEIATTAQVKLAYEKLVGQTVHKTTIYRLLDRHEWRKIVPRQSHPKADPEEQEAFKKTSNNKLNKS